MGASVLTRLERKEGRTGSGRGEAARQEAGREREEVLAAR